jgi:hypothetical protein
MIPLYSRSCESIICHLNLESYLLNVSTIRSTLPKKCVHQINHFCEGICQVSLLHRLWLCNTPCENNNPKLSIHAKLGIITLETIDHDHDHILNSLIMATSHTRLRAHDHCTSSKLIGKGGASPKFASHYAWGTNRVCECNMDVKST